MFAVMWIDGISPFLSFYYSELVEDLAVSFCRGNNIAPSQVRQSKTYIETWKVSGKLSGAQVYDKSILQWVNAPWSVVE